MRVLVTGGTGKIGSALVPKLVATGARVTVLTRSRDRAPAGVDVVVGDLLDMDVMNGAIGACDALFLNCPVDPTELYQGLLAVDIAERKGIGKLVYLSGQDAAEMFTAPHCAVKVPTEQVVRACGLPYAILRPNTFMQNDLMLKDLILGGFYPLPLGDVGVSRVDVEDIADIAIMALTSSKLDQQTVTIVGPEVMTSASTAAAWSRALGHEVAVAGDISTFEQVLRMMLSPAEARDVWLMYEQFNLRGFKAPEGAVERLTGLLGRPPGSFAEFTARTAAEWKGDRAHAGS